MRAHWLSMVSLIAATCIGPGCASVKTATPSVAEAQPGEDHARRGLELAKQGDDFGAEQYFQAAIKAGYSERAATRLMVTTCIAGGRLERARTHAERYVERNPADWIFLHVLASIYFAEGQADQASQLLALVLSEHPDHAPSHFLQGMVMRDQVGDFAAARASFERYLALAPSGEHHEEARAWLRRARSYPMPKKSKEDRR
jgi:tetratricopeptide (TPR) repeat protein